VLVVQATALGNDRTAAVFEIHVVSPREDVGHVRIHETTLVVANVDDDAGLRLVADVEIDRQTRERLFGHVEDVHVPESAAREPVDESPPRIDPRTIAQRSCCLPINRRDRNIVAVDPYDDALPDLVFQQRFDVGVRVERRSVDGFEFVTDVNAAAQAQRPEREHLCDPQMMRAAVVGGVELGAEITRARSVGIAHGTDAKVR